MALSPHMGNPVIACVIPARGGSKRTPRKNVKDFFGLPVIVYSINTALQSGLFDITVVSTDDDEISEVATKWGAEVLRRSAENSDDHATDFDVISETLRCMNPDYLCYYYPVAPMVRIADLREAKALCVSGVSPVVAAKGEYYFIDVKAFTLDDYYSPFMLRECWDVDTLEDWDRLRAAYMAREAV